MRKIHIVWLAALVWVFLGCPVPSGPRTVTDAGVDGPEPINASHEPPPSQGQNWADHPDFPHFEFGFESATDPLSRDLAQLLIHQRSSYPDSESYGLAMENVAMFEKRVRGDAESAALLLGDELLALDPSNASAATSLLGLLDLVREEPAAAEAIQAYLMPDAPERAGQSCGSRSCSTDGNGVAGVRNLALHTLAQAARVSEFAREALLDTAASADPVVREGVVQHYMGVRGSRMHAKAELRGKLASSEHYWLFRH
jgi:hypothetical protein